MNRRGRKHVRLAWGKRKNWHVAQVMHGCDCHPVHKAIETRCAASLGSASHDAPSLFTYFKHDALLMPVSLSQELYHHIEIQAPHSMCIVRRSQDVSRCRRFLGRLSSAIRHAEVELRRHPISNRAVVDFAFELRTNYIPPKMSFFKNLFKEVNIARSY